MTAMHWIIGPQLLGAIFLIAGYIQKWCPPKTINGFYGYRTDSSMKNQQTWDEGNRYSTRIMIRYAWVLLAVGIAITVPMEFISIKEDAFMLIKVGLMIAGSLIMVVVLISSTEKHLRETFDNKSL